jgi:hypothetical protein
LRKEAVVGFLVKTEVLALEWLGARTKEWVKVKNKVTETLLMSVR